MASMKMTKKAGMAAAVAAALVVAAPGCATMGEPVDASRYCFKSVPKDSSYCRWYYDEQYQCWMCDDTKINNR